MIAVSQQRQRTCRFAKRDGRARAGAVFDEPGQVGRQILLGITGDVHDLRDVVHDRGIDVDTPDDVLDVEDVLDRSHRCTLVIRVDAGIDPEDDLRLFRGVRVGQNLLEHESVHLRLRQWIGPLLVDRILRGQHQEWFRDLVDLSGDAGLSFLHRLQHGALRLRTGTVDLVQQHDVGMHRAELGLERAL
ncbi:Uncharacterised protein [Mycobacteroides abscessus subsp. abscessus]|nr:Uncharacterised protein [Mycobacteroides abscessus subsp. abscessus]